MEKLYEEYIANKLKQTKTIFTLIKTQHSQYALFNMKNDKKVNVYRIQPYIVSTSTINNVVIIDTKWKLLDRSGPRQFDLNQMYTNYTRYKHFGMNVRKVVRLSVDDSNKELGLESVVEVVYVDFSDKEWVHRLWEKISEV